MKQRRKRLLVRGATFSYVLLLILAAIPELAPVVVWFIPAPLLYMWMQGQRSRALMLSFTTFLFALFGGSLAYLMFPVLFSLLLAIVMGEGAMRGDVPLTPYSLGTILLLGLSILVMGVAHSKGISIPTQIGTQVQELIQHDPVLQTTLTASDLQTIATDYKQTIIETFPGMLTIASFLVVFVHFTLVRFLIRKKHPEQMPEGGLSSWRLPWGVAIASVVSIVAANLPWSESYSELRIVSSNLACISSFFLALQGLSLIWRLLSRYHRGKWAMAIMIALCFVRMFWIVYGVFGLLDILVWRKRTINK